MHHINTFLWLVNQVRGSLFTYSSQQKLAKEVRVLPISQLPAWWAEKKKNQNNMPAEENIMPFRHVIRDSEKRWGTTRSADITKKTPSIMIYNNERQKLGRFFDVVSPFTASEPAVKSFPIKDVNPFVAVAISASSLFRSQNRHFLHYTSHDIIDIIRKYVTTSK